MSTMLIGFRSTLEDESDSVKNEELFESLMDTDDSSLERKVKKTEGVNGATVEPVYSTRKMKCYSVTESELKQIGLANLGITAFASIGSGFLAFWLDIFKDTFLADSVPETAQSAINYVQPILLYVGIAFWLLCGATLYWRRNMIQIIKDESVTGG